MKKKAVFVTVACVVAMLGVLFACFKAGAFKSKASEVEVEGLSIDYRCPYSEAGATVRFDIPFEWAEEISYKVYANGVELKTETLKEQITYTQENLQYIATIRAIPANYDVYEEPYITFTDGKNYSQSAELLGNSVYGIYGHEGYGAEIVSADGGTVAVPLYYKADSKVKAVISYYELDTDELLYTLEKDMEPCGYEGYVKCTYGLAALPYWQSVEFQYEDGTIDDNNGKGYKISSRDTIAYGKVYDSTPAEVKTEVETTDYYVGYFSECVSWGDDIRPLVEIAGKTSDPEYKVLEDTEIEDMLGYASNEIFNVFKISINKDIAENDMRIAFSDGVNSSKWSMMKAGGVYDVEGLYTSFIDMRTPGNAYTTIYYKTSQDVTAFCKMNGKIDYKEGKLVSSYFEGYRYIRVTSGAWPESSCSFKLADGSIDDNDGEEYPINTGGTFTITDGYLYATLPDNIENVEPKVTPKSKLDTVSIYYMTTWNAPNAHYSINDGEWTAVPGISMGEYQYTNGNESAYLSKITAKSTDKIRICFNDGYNNWDNNSGNNYVLTGSDAYTVMQGKIYKKAVNKLETKNKIVIEYYTGWTTPYIHYTIGNSGRWTEEPGKAMETNSSGYAKYTIDLGLESSAKVCFNNGSGSWDNNGGNDYYFAEPGNYSVKDGSIAKIVPNETIKDDVNETNDEVTIYYSCSSDIKDVNIHYCIGDNGWTNVPGVKMDMVKTGLYAITLNIEPSEKVQFCFNYNNGVWDNNNGQDYTLAGVGEYTVTAK